MTRFSFQLQLVGTEDMLRSWKTKILSLLVYVAASCVLQTFFVVLVRLREAFLAKYESGSSEDFLSDVIPLTKISILTIGAMFFQAMNHIKDGCDGPKCQKKHFQLAEDEHPTYLKVLIISSSGHIYAVVARILRAEKVVTVSLSLI